MHEAKCYNEFRNSEHEGYKMKRENIEFDMSYLRSIVDKKIGREQLARVMGVSEGRLSELLGGRCAFRMDEMMSCVLLLGLEREEFERCFFSAKSSGNLNSDKNKHEVRE